MRITGMLASVALLVAACSSDPGGSGGSSSTSTSTSGSGGHAGHGGTATGGHGGASAGGASTGGAATGGAGTGATGGSTTGTGGTGTVWTCPSGGAPDCSQGSGTGEQDQCFDAPSCYLGIVQNAVKWVINTGYPEWVDWSDGNPHILDDHQNDYVLAVVDEVSLHDLCAIQDPNAGDEIVVKKDNDFSENFDILTAQGYARYGGGIWTATCAPAWF